ncbi:MAG: NADH-quinone oxidoreductase subunit J [Actinomycetes bacterium]
MVAQNVAFGILAVAMVLAAIGVVRTHNVVHAALYLVVVLAGAAAQYILLAAEFVAWVQVLIYIGAVVILFLFGIMLTRAPMGDLAGLDNRQGLPAVVATLALIGTLTALLVDAFAKQEVVLDAPTPTADIATQVFKVYVVPFEAVSILLLAALVGAIVLARRD